MKVNNDSKAAVQNAQAAQVTKTNEAKSKAKTDLKSDILKVNSGETAQSAQVDLSSKVKDAKKAKEVAMSSPDVRSDKVKKLQEMIDKGDYKVDAKKIADKMVDEELMNAAATKG